MSEKQTRRISGKRLVPKKFNLVSELNKVKLRLLAFFKRHKISNRTNKNRNSHLTRREKVALMAMLLAEYVSLMTMLYTESDTGIGMQYPDLFSEKVIEIFDDTYNPDYLSGIGLISPEAQQIIAQKYEQLQEVLRHKNYSADNSDSEERNLEIHSYLYAAFWLIVENYYSHQSVDVKFLPIEDILENFIMSVEMNNGITLVYDTEELESDKLGVKELR